MPLAARMENWLSAVDVKSALVLSAQTNDPVFTALARRPAAMLNAPARLLRPPGIVAYEPVAILPSPPPTVAATASLVVPALLPAVLPRPPLIVP
jgi:hypothetical protein